MASADITVTGEDVLEAITTHSGRLNDEGMKLANLIADQVLLILQERLGERKDKKDDSWG